MLVHVSIVKSLFLPVNFANEFLTVFVHYIKKTLPENIKNIKLNLTEYYKRTK